MKNKIFEEATGLYDTIKKLIYKLNKDDIFALSAQLAYNLLLSVFPFLMFLFTVIGMSNLNAEEVLHYLSNIIPENAYELIESTVVEIISNAQSGILWISIFLAIWTASSGFRAVIKGLNNAYDTSEERGFIMRTILAILCIIALVLIIVSTLFLLVFGDVIGQYIANMLPLNRLLSLIWDLFRFVFLVLIMVFMCGALYYIAPAKKIKWKDAMPGAIIATLGWYVVSMGFSYYVNNFNNYSRLYGSLGGVVILMTWIYLMSFILLLGGEINAVLVEECN